MTGYPGKNYSQPTKRYIQYLELKDDSDLISKYRYLHSREGHWKEIRDGIRDVGILEMEIYILDTKLVMVIDAPIDLDLDKAMARLATLPRQQEWEETVAQFQKCSTKATSADKWKEMERMFYLY